jgi:hypothetical protein
MIKLDCVQVGRAFNSLYLVKAYLVTTLSFQPLPVCKKFDPAGGFNWYFARILRPLINKGSHFQRASEGSEMPEALAALISLTKFCP